MTLQIVDIPYVSPSALSTLTTCERQWWWSYVMGRKSPPTEATAMGHGFATALEHGDLGRGIEDYYAVRPQPDDWTDPEVDARHAEAARATIKHAYRGYTTRWPDADTTREVTYLVDVEDCERVLQVRVDGVTPTHLIEDKLRAGSSLRSDDITNEVMQGRQLTAEVYAHWRKTGEIVPVHLRCMKKCDPRKWRTIPQAEIDAVIGEHFEAPGAFNEYIATRTYEQLKTFETELKDAITRVGMLDFDDRPRGVRNTSACHLYGRPCPALSECQGRAG